MYNVRKTIFSDQTGQFPKRSLRGNKHIMVLVEIDSNVIITTPMKSRHNDKMKRAYKSMVNQLHRAGIVPKKHVLDNKVSKSTNAMIRDKYHITMELMPPGCHRRNTAEVTIQNFKAHFLGVLLQRIGEFLSAMIGEHIRIQLILIPLQTISNRRTSSISTAIRQPSLTSLSLL